MYTRLGGLLRGALSLGPEAARFGTSRRACHIRPSPEMRRFATQSRTSHKEWKVAQIRSSPWLRRFATQGRITPDPSGKDSREQS